jgi:ribosomal protein S18 acetylase RimI-like enzyme
MTEMIETPGMLETDRVAVRTLRESDLAMIVRIDAEASGRKRPRYFELMLQRSVRMAGLQVSLVAELEDRAVGFLIASLHYGEFGVTEPTAAIEAINVARDARNQGVGKALMRQLRLNLAALGVTSIRTVVEWNDFELLAFFQSEGFALGRRLCLERPLDPTAPGD